MQGLLAEVLVPLGATVVSPQQGSDPAPALWGQLGGCLFPSFFFFFTKEEVNSAAIAFQTTILDGVLVAARRAPAPIKAHRVHGWNANGTAQCGLLRGHHGAPFLPMPEQPDCHSHPMMGGSPGSTLFLGQFLSFQPKAAIQERSFGSQLPPAAPAALRHICVCACP